MTLANILPLDNSDLNDLFLFDMSLQSKKMYSMTVIVTGSGPLKATLV